METPPKMENRVGFPSTTMFQHTGSILVKDFLARKNVTILGHRHYSHELVGGDFYLFSRLKINIEGVALL
jgi:hypothetical protein